MARFPTLCCGLLILLTVTYGAEEELDDDPKKFMLNLQKNSRYTTLNRFFHNSFVADLAFQDKFRDPKKQFIAAARTKVEINSEENSLSLSMHGGLFFWENTNWSDFKADCDDECMRSLGGLTTTGTSTPIKDDTTIHTELQMLYGKRGRTQLMKPAIDNSHIIVMYTRSVPCSQLRPKTDGTAHFAECAGDMKNYRYARVDSSPMIITVYSKVYSMFGIEDKTNERVSNLYLKIGGIPSYQVKITEALIRDRKIKDLQLENDGFEKYFEKPSAQVFPRLASARQYDRPRRFVKCIVEDDDILSEIMETNVEFQIAFTRTNSFDYKEVVYRIISQILIIPSDAGDIVIKEDVDNLYGKLRSPSAKHNYDVCKEFGEYFDGTHRYKSFYEDKVENEKVVCTQIIQFNDGFIEQGLCPDREIDEKLLCAQYWCHQVIYRKARKRPRIEEPEE